MLSTIKTGAIVGVKAVYVQTEVDLSFGLNLFQIVGLPAGAVCESKTRVMSAIGNSNWGINDLKITVNLAPANLRKQSTSFDLPIAVAILVAKKWLPDTVDDYIFAGELALDGSLRPTTGILPLAVLARDMNLKGIVVAADNAAEAACVTGIEVLGFSNLRQLADHFACRKKIVPFRRSESTTEKCTRYPIDFKDVSGQDLAKRAIEIAAAGGHNILLIGPPGSGKSMLSQRIPTILPPMNFDESLETTSVYSVTGQLQQNSGLVTQRPFRAPHHTISDVGIVGGGSHMPHPGEVSLAHNGVLFLDELPEFRRNVLEVLRQPLEERYVAIRRGHVTLQFPANIMLVAAMNPCPCGYYGSENVRPCNCSAEQILRYRSRISGPLLDRIDLHVEVNATPYSQLRSGTPGESSADIQARVAAARKVQERRYANERIHSNAAMRPKMLRQYCGLTADCEKLMEHAVNNLGMSGRAYTRILKVARTIADLEGSEVIERHQIAEAIRYRTLDRMLHKVERRQEYRPSL